MQGRNLKIAVFLEGVRIPVSQVTVNAQANRPARARIDLAASPVIEDIQPKTHVLIFFEELVPGPRPLPFQDSLQLLFEGEVVGSGWAQSATGNATSFLECEDLSNYFQRAPAYFFRNNFLDQEATETIAFTLGPEGEEQARFLANANIQGITSDVEVLMLQANKDSITRAFMQIFERTAQLNAYFRRSNTRLKIVNTGRTGALDLIGEPLPEKQGRLALKDDPEAIVLYNPDLTDLAKHLVRNQDILLPLQEIMARLMELVHYQFWPQVCPSFEVDEVTENARPVNFAIKPTTFFSIPPAFNVFFPGSYTAVNVTRNFMEEPTRLRMRFTSLKSLVQKPVATAKYAPSGMKEIIGAVFGEEGQERAKDVGNPSAFNAFGDVALEQTISKLLSSPLVLFDEVDFRLDNKFDNPATRPNRVLLRPGNGVPVESDEELKGIIPREIKVPSSTFVLSQGRLAAVEDQYFTQLAEFLLFLEQHQNRVVQITADFNPYVALGFPFLLLQETMGPKFGELASISHTIIDEAGGTTQLILSYTHDKDVISARVQDPETGETQFRPAEATLRAAPLWINKAFLPENVDKVEFEAARINPLDPSDDEPFERGLGGWRYFFGDSGVAFWRNYPAGSKATVTISPELVDFSKRRAADLLLDFYRSQGDEGRNAMVERFGRRRIATLRDMASFLGFTIQSEQRLGGAIFEDRLSVREPVERLKLDLERQATRL